MTRAVLKKNKGFALHETESPDLLSMIMFDPHSLNHFIEIRESDAEKKAQDIVNLLCEAPNYVKLMITALFLKI